MAHTADDVSLAPNGTDYLQQEPYDLDRRFLLGLFPLPLNWYVAFRQLWH